MFVAVIEAWLVSDPEHLRTLIVFVPLLALTVREALVVT